MARRLSRQHVVETDTPPRESFFPHGSSGILPLAPTPPHSNVNDETPPGGPCCSGAGHHGCGCGCPGCWCRLITSFKDESNREAYGGQGGHGGRLHHRRHPGMPGPADMSRSDRVPSPSSFQSSSSYALSNGSFDSGFEAPAPPVRHHPAARAVVLNGARRAVLESDPDEDGPHPWHSFVESPVSSSLDHISFSVVNRSTLSSRYEPSVVHGQPPSESASQIVAQAGTAFDDLAFVAPRFLRLTPE